MQFIQTGNRLCIETHNSAIEILLARHNRSAFRSPYLYLFNHFLLSHSIMFDSLALHGLQHSVMEFPRQEYWNRVPFSSPGDLPDTGFESTSPVSLMHCRWILYVETPGIPFSQYFNSKYQPKLPATPRFFLRLYVCFEIAVMYQF